MPELPIYNFKGEVVGNKLLDEKVFGVKVKSEVVTQAVVAQEANAREAIAHTKDRSEVRGGGKKPWKQKGTGRARHGSIRSPLWKGGGVTFGPTKDRNFSIKINKKARKLALRMVLSDKAESKNIFAIEDALFPEQKTHFALELLKNLKLRRVSAKKQEGKEAGLEKKDEKEPRVKNKSILVVLPKEKKEYAKYFRNLDKVAIIGAESLNVIDALKSHYIIMTVQSIDVVSKIYS